MMGTKKHALLPLTIALALVSGVFIGIKLKDNIPQQSRLLFFSQSTNKTTQALDIIRKSYVDNISINMLEEEAIRSMLRRLDPHSQYIPARNYASVNDPLVGNFSGIGVRFNMFHDTIVVINTFEDGPSEKAGILSGDRIVKVNDSTVAGVRMPSNDIMEMLKGATGTQVKVSVHRRGNIGLLDFTITRDRIPDFSVEPAYMITPETGYIKVERFSRTTFREFTQAAERLREEGMTKMILDLRDNPGGVIDGAVRMSEMFLPEGKMIVYTEGERRARTNHYSRSTNADFSKMELVILINEGSASASEIVAGAIQDNDRGMIIGRRSFGKGLVQEQHLLPDSSALRITVARYYTPTGRCIQKPYDPNNRSEYFNEVRGRFALGELIQEDSIRINDSLRFVTPAGRIVYGGGGIIPDIFVPLDTSFISNYYRQVNRRQIIYSFALEYTDRNRRELSEIQDYKAMENHLRRKNILNDFVAYAARQGVPRNENDLTISGQMIENISMAYIARNILNQKGYYPILNQKDKMVQRAVEELRMKNEE